MAMASSISSPSISIRPSLSNRNLCKLPLSRRVPSVSTPYLPRHTRLNVTGSSPMLGIKNKEESSRVLPSFSKHKEGLLHFVKYHGLGNDFILIAVPVKGLLLGFEILGLVLCVAGGGYFVNCCLRINPHGVIMCTQNVGHDVDGCTYPLTDAASTSLGLVRWHLPTIGLEINLHGVITCTEDSSQHSPQHQWWNVDNRDSMEPRISSKQAIKLCDRNFGVGADGVIFAMPGVNGTDYSMRIFNSDGSEPEGLCDVVCKSSVTLEELNFWYGLASSKS
eukprot:Gb_29213 [translate_table: standard]